MLAFFKKNWRDMTLNDLTNLIVIFLKPLTFHTSPKNPPIIDVHGTRGSVCLCVCLCPPAVVVRDTADKSTNIWRSQTSATSRAAKNLKNDDRQAPLWWWYCRPRSRKNKFQTNTVAVFHARHTYA